MDAEPYRGAAPVASDHRPARACAARHGEAVGEAHVGLGVQRAESSAQARAGSTGAGRGGRSRMLAARCTRPPACAQAIHRLDSSSRRASVWRLESSRRPRGATAPPGAGRGRGTPRRRPAGPRASPGRPRRRRQRGAHRGRDRRRQPPARPRARPAGAAGDGHGHAVTLSGARRAAMASVAEACRPCAPVSARLFADARGPPDLAAEAEQLVRFTSPIDTTSIFSIFACRPGPSAPRQPEPLLAHRERLAGAGALALDAHPPDTCTRWRWPSMTLKWTCSASRRPRTRAVRAAGASRRPR